VKTPNTEKKTRLQRIITMCKFV